MNLETAVLIPTFNGKELLRECLNSLRAQTYKNFKIIVIDDASSDQTLEFLQTEFPEVEVIKNEKNLGFAKTVNSGIAHIKKAYNPKFIAILNNDTRAENGWLGALVSRAEKEPEVAAVASNMFFYGQPDLINSQGGTIDWNGDGYDINFGLSKNKGKIESGPVFSACWGAALLRASCLDKIGILDEKFNAYFEDLDWSWRANTLGYKLVFEKEAIILHKHSASYKSNQYKKIYLCKRNALRAALKNYEAKNLKKNLAHIILGYWFAIVGYLKTDRHQLPTYKKITYATIPLLALAWNLLNILDTLKARKKIQRERIIPDETVLKLIEQDSTPVREWLKNLKSRFGNYSDLRKEMNRIHGLGGITLQTEYGLSSKEVGELKEFDTLITKFGILKNKPTNFLDPIQEKTIKNYFEIVLSNLPFKLANITKKDLFDIEKSIVIEACLFCLNFDLKIDTKNKLLAGKEFLTSQKVDWDKLSQFAEQTQAFSQVYFYLKSIDSTMPEVVLQKIKNGGSQIQNIVLNRVKITQGKTSIPFLIYSQMYLKPGLVRLLTTKAHYLYNLKTGKKIETTEEVKFGVNVFGFLDSESGVGEAARTLIRAIKRVNLPIALINNPNVPHRRKDTEFSKKFQNNNPYSINIISIFGDVMEQEMRYFGEDKFKNRYNIAYWAWELANLPKAWIPLLDRVDEVWAMSNFVMEAIKKERPNLPVTVIPQSIKIEKTPYGRGHFNLSKDKFIFLFMFDFYSYFERKNPLAIIEAFKLAFGKNEEVLLLIKCSNSKIDPKNFETLKKAGRQENIQIIDSYLEREEINSLINICDCYISLHRSEGFGLTMAEAMSLGKPVIATNYSSNTDFMNEENSFPIKYKLVELEKNYGVYTKGNFWAEPDIKDSSDKIRLVYEHSEVGLRRASLGRAEILKNFSPETVGKIIEKRLRKIRFK